MTMTCPPNQSSRNGITKNDITTKGLGGDKGRVLNADRDTLSDVDGDGVPLVSTLNLLFSIRQV
jgi:hypothetical protein